MKMLKNKIILNAAIISLGILVIILLMISTYFSNKSTDCSYEVNKLLLDKTQQFVEKQYLLIQRTWAIDRRNAFQAVGNKEEAESAQSEIPGPYIEYQSFIRAMAEQDINVSQKMDDCKTKENISAWFLISALIVAIIQFIFSVVYIRTYR